MFIYKVVIYTIDTVSNLARFYNSVYSSSPTIHLVSEVPAKGRAQSFCGAVLRKGHWFDTSTRYAELLGKDKAYHVQRYTAYTKKIRSNHRENYPHDYLDNICPVCADSPEVGLDLLAQLP